MALYEVLINQDYTKETVYSVETGDMISALSMALEEYKVEGDTTEPTQVRVRLLEGKFLRRQ